VTGPFDTIREALESITAIVIDHEGRTEPDPLAGPALAALTEVEQREAALVRRAEKAERRGDRNGNEANEQRNRAVAAEQRANDLEQRIAICPYCAHGFEKQEGRSYGACPGCERAHELQRQNDALGMIGAALTDDLDDMERRANDLADALRAMCDRIDAEDDPAWDSPSPLDAARAALDRHTHQDKAVT
jgi:hypothetical protein